MHSAHTHGREEKKFSHHVNLDSKPGPVPGCLVLKVSWGSRLSWNCNKYPSPLQLTTTSNITVSPYKHKQQLCSLTVHPDVPQNKVADNIDMEIVRDGRSLCVCVWVREYEPNKLNSVQSYCMEARWGEGWWAFSVTLAHLSSFSFSGSRNSTTHDY